MNDFSIDILYFSKGLIIEATITISLSEYNGLQSRILSLTETVSVLTSQLTALQEELRLLRNGKNSGTSHTPPSHVLGAPNRQSLRQKTGRKSGGQKGHEGTTLQIKALPDELIDYIPQYCTDCGESLQAAEAKVVESRQEVVIPPVRARYVAHRSHCKTCPCCGRICTASMPEHLTAPIQYGKSVAAAVSYLSVYQYLSYRRIGALMRDFFGVPISEGSIDNLLEDCTQKARPVYDLIQRRVQHSPVVGSDETGTSVGGKKGWFHTWQTPRLTFVAASMNRGYQTIAAHFSEGFPLSVYVSDCWAAQLKVQARLHQLCTAHLLRELRNFEEALNCTWSASLKELLQEAIALKKELEPRDYVQAPVGVVRLEQRLDELLKADNTAAHKKVQAFQKRLIKHSDSLLTFLHHADVPADNNGSERAIRNVKVKTKVSGGFRTERGAERFAILRSVIDTTIKNTGQVFQGLTSLFCSNEEQLTLFESSA